MGQGVGAVRTACLALAAVVMPVLAWGAVLNQVDVPAPLSPQAAKGGIKLASGRLANPDQPLWVSYSLIAVSATEKPKGHLVLDAAPEGVAVPLTETKVLFSPQNMASVPRGSTFADRLQEQVGGRTPEQLQASLGTELAAAYQALLAHQGALYAKTVVRVYPAPHKDEVLLLASLDPATDLQPVLISVAMGQGDVPPEYQDAYAKLLKGRGVHEKWMAILMSLAIAAFLVYRKFKS